MTRFLNTNLCWAIPATLAIAVIWAVSAIANYYFGASLGTDKVFDALFFEATTAKLFSNASLAADVLKCLTLFAFAASVTLGHWKAATVTGCIWLVCTAWSVASAVGFVAINHNVVTDTRGKGVEEWTQLDMQVKNLTERRNQVAAARPEGAVQAEISQLLRTPGVGDCSVVNGPITREICPQVDKLKIELANAKSAAWLDGRLDELRAEVKKSDRVTSENPFADLVSGLLGVVATQKITMGQALWFALLLELISGPGLWAIWASVPKPATRAQDNRTASKPSGATTLPAASVSPVYAAAARSEMRPRKDVLEKVLGVEAKSNSPEIPDGSADHVRDVAKVTPVSADYAPTAEHIAENANCSPDPDGPGTPVQAIPDKDDLEAIADNNVLPFKASHDTTADWKIDRRASENSVTRWLRDRTQASATRRGNEAHKLLPDYLRYCRQRGETPLSKRKFSTVLRGELDLPKLRGADGKRKSAVMLFPIELITTQTAKRKVA